MKGILPTFTEFSRFNDGYMLKVRKKPRNPKALKVLYYPFALLGLCLLYGTFFHIVAGLKRSSRYSYRTSKNYRKVIKEGILFDTVEYHER